MNEHELNHNELNEHAQDNCLRQPPINSRVSQQICCQATPLHGMFYKCAAEDVQRNMLRRMEREQRRNRRREWRTRNSTVSTTTTTQSPPIETDEEPRARFVCYLENSTMFDRSYRMQTKAVLEVAMCAFGANSSYAPSVPHFVDHCVAAYGAAVQAMPDDMLHPEYGCLSRSTFLVECLHDQFFVHCPADKWNSGMGKLCGRIVL